MVNTTDPNALYEYNPSTAAAGVFALLYTAAFIATFVLWIKYRAWVWVVIVVGALMEALGYIARTISSRSPNSQGIYIIQQLFIIIPPVVMAAAYYIVFGRIVFHVVPPGQRTLGLLWIPPRFLTPIFVCCDILAFFTQAIGATMLIPRDNESASKQASNFKTGKTVILLGLGIQIVCFGFFSIIAGRFHVISKRFDADYDRRVGGMSGDKYYSLGPGKKLLRNWRTLLYIVNTTCVLILIRSIYRVIEFVEGRGGNVQTHEWYAYVFDAAIIFPCVALYTVWHPAKYLPYLGFRLPPHIREGKDYVDLDRDVIMGSRGELRSNTGY